MPWTSLSTLYRSANIRSSYSSEITINFCAYKPKSKWVQITDTTMLQCSGDYKLLHNDAATLSHPQTEAWYGRQQLIQCLSFGSRALRLSYWRRHCCISSWRSRDGATSRRRHGNRERRTTGRARRRSATVADKRVTCAHVTYHLVHVSVF